MPTATPYYGKARGNGFPFCLERVNVADSDGEGTPYDYWSTLGGTNKGNVADLTAEEKAANISLSLQNAWRLYWNLYSVTFEALSSGGVVTEPIYQELEYTETPVSRVCNRPPQKNSSVPYDSGWVDVFADIDEIVRMYNGPTTEETNFVGYGATLAYILFDRASFIYLELKYAENIGADGGVIVLCDYVNFQDISFVAAAGSSGDATPLTIGDTDGKPSLFSSVEDMTITLNSLEFYNQ